MSAIGMRDPSSSARDETIFARRLMEKVGWISGSLLGQ
jgi:hypothetical protein